MKLSAIASLAVVMMATNSLMGMDGQKEKGNLRFLCDNKCHIQSYSNNGMKFEIKPRDFLGKSIVGLLPFDHKDREAITQGFSKARDNVGQTFIVPYTFKDTGFMAKITAMNTRDRKQNAFAVKVQEVQEVKEDVYPLL